MIELEKALTNQIYTSYCSFTFDVAADVITMIPLGTLLCYTYKKSPVSFGFALGPINMCYITHKANLHGPTSIHWNLVIDAPGSIPRLQRERLLQLSTSNHEEWEPKIKGK